jgi:arsenite methyltransferase
MKEKTDDQVKKTVRDGYARIVRQDGCACTPACCGGRDLADNVSQKIGYSDQELKSVPEGANLGLGCGNPVALASLKEGETVLDLGCGGGFDCFLAANKVGSSGRVIGVDMTPEMLDRARANARQGNYQNVEFRLGEIENLPAADNSVDVVISNCVINLSPDKSRVFREAFRVLRPGGRLMVSDIVLLQELPGWLKESIDAYIGCLSGAMKRKQYLDTIKAAGFRDVRIIDEMSFPIDYMLNDPTAQALIKNLNLPLENLNEIARSAVSVKVSGVKPAATP